MTSTGPPSPRRSRGDERETQGTRLYDYSQLLAHGWLAFALVAWTSLSVGSFLNVVIYRLPVMLDRQWRDEARALFHIATAKTQTFNLAQPRSRCPRCGHLIRALQNVPVISWLALRGKCAHCHSRISVRYPMVELVAFVIVLPVIALWGYSLTSALYAVFLWALIALALIDYDTQLLPDQITLPLVWLGLIAAYARQGTGDFPSLESALIGALVGYLVLWTIYWVFKLITGREGMGYGDFKLLAALGAWLGWQMLPTIVLVASATGLAFAVVAIWLERHARAQPMAFGPFLSISGCVTLLLTPEFSLLSIV